MHRTAYGGLAQIYDRFMRDASYSSWVDWTLSMWQQHWGHLPSNAVELGCGTGNIAIPLAEAGVSMIGIDLSEDMLACAQAKWENKNHHDHAALSLSCQDMTQWTWAEPVDSVLAYCDTFNYLIHEEDLLNAFRCAYDRLTPGGLILFDLLPEERFLYYATEQPFVVDEGDIAYHWFSEYDKKKRWIEHDITFFIQEGDLYRKEREVHKQRSYGPEWVLFHLAEAGFAEPEGFTRLFPDAEDLNDRYFFKAVKPL